MSLSLKSFGCDVINRMRCTPSISFTILKRSEKSISKSKSLPYELTFCPKRKSAVTGESIFRNTYTAQGGAGEIAFASSFPGDIICFDTSVNPIVAQKSSYLANTMGVNMEIFFQKKLGAGFFGGEGFIMQKFSGNGVVFLEIDGSVCEYTLAAGQSMLIDTGYLAAMEATCSIDIETVKGIGNVLMGGEGLFNTKVTGPGKIWLQTMPANVLADTIKPFIPTGSN